MHEYELILVDSPGLIHAMFYYNQFGTESVFLDSIKDLSNKWKNARIVLLFDHHDSSSPRREIYKPYKTREHQPGVGEMLESCYQRARASGYVTWVDPRYEADDLIATIVREYCDHYTILMVGKDQDLHANLSDRVHQLVGTIAAQVRKEAAAMFAPVDFTQAENLAVANAEFGLVDDTSIESMIMTPTKVYEKLGIWPSQWHDYRALMGEPGDTIPGVKDIGDKTARTLIAMYNNMNGVVTNVEMSSITKKRKAAIMAAAADGTIDTMLSLVRPIFATSLPDRLLELLGPSKNRLPAMTDEVHTTGKLQATQSQQVMSFVPVDNPHTLRGAVAKLTLDDEDDEEVKPSNKLADIGSMLQDDD